MVPRVRGVILLSAQIDKVAEKVSARISSLVQVGADLVEQCARQVVVLQQVAKLQEHGCVGHRFARQVGAHEAAQCLAVVERVFQRLVGQPISPPLQAVHGAATETAIMTQIAARS